MTGSTNRSTGSPLTLIQFIQCFVFKNHFLSTLRDINSLPLPINVINALCSSIISHPPFALHPSRSLPKSTTTRFIRPHHHLPPPVTTPRATSLQRTSPLVHVPLAQCCSDCTDCSTGDVPHVTAPRAARIGCHSPLDRRRPPQRSSASGSALGQGLPGTHETRDTSVIAGRGSRPQT